MLTTLKSFIKQVFGPISYQTELERFIISKQPSSVGEIEYWAKVYDRKGGHYGRR